MLHLTESLLVFYGREWMSVDVTDILVTIEFLVLGDMCRFKAEAASSV